MASNEDFNLGYSDLAGGFLKGEEQLLGSGAKGLQSDYIRQQLQFHHDLSEERAQEALDRGRFEQGQEAEKIAATTGTEAAISASQGVDTSTGTSKTITDQTSDRGSIDYQTIGNNAWLTSFGFRADALDDKTKMAMESLSAQNEQQGGLLGALESVVGGGLKAFSHFEDNA